VAQQAEVFDRGANLLGALALRVADRVRAAVATELSESAATALSAIHNFLDAPRIDQLAQVLGLSSSGTVRLVDGLAAQGLVARRPGADGRESVVALTSAGRRRAQAVTRARAEVLAEALSPLSKAERAAFEDAVEKVLIELVRGPRGRGWMCRLCDTTSCGAERGQPCSITRDALGLRTGATTA
jgi:MarR family transcriptional regulator, negative regulator of the multidrug operon emrRAB